MICPRCLQDNTSLINNSHYVCNNSECVDENGSRTQFHLVIDDKVQFPYNQIFINRNKNEFFRKPMLVLPIIKSSVKKL